MDEVLLPERMELAGMRLVGARAESTAAGLGIQDDDLLVSIGGRMASTRADLEAALRCYRENESLSAHWIRGAVLMYAETPARPISSTGEITGRVMLGVRLGQQQRVEVESLAGSPLSDFQRAVLDWSTQSHEKKRIARWGGVLAGSILGVGAGLLVARAFAPRSFPLKVIR